MKSDPRVFWLLVINCCLIFGITTGELEFYPDVEPESSEVDTRLRQLEHFLGNQNRQRLLRRDHTPPHPHPKVYEEDFINYRQHEREREILEALVENPTILNILEKNKPNYIYQRPNYRLQYERSTSQESPYINANLEPPSNIYPKLKIPYPEHTIDENSYFGNSRYPVKMSLPERDTYEDNIESSPERLQDQIMTINAQKSNKLSLNFVERIPEFTYYFDKPTLGESQNMFAVNPNDPRYYENQKPPAKEEKDLIIEEDEPPALKAPWQATTDDEKIVQSPERNVEHKISKLTSADLLPEPQRRADRDPVVTFTSNKSNDDVYFIAIVAGCSAAAMFALVLISLTWCRLQRGVKAAADIEYPAYGVTGPNKDVSPSGDQRLAQSAQMYHFQHQKQQIIAMEKSAASRDPGSVSEAESDEENEEGDYTVYECPGLAPAGEVEVKNPMFHDDPTPATPQNNREEDHHH